MSTIGNRMKESYEDRYRIKLPRRTNTIIRVDGKCFHTLLKNADKPFDDEVSYSMDRAMIKASEEIQGFKFAYTQSDEISFLLTDYDSLDSCSWFDGNIQKLCSIVASICSISFTKDWGKDALFDARCFVIPEREEVINYFIWRQQDAIRNSLNLLAQSMFSHKELQGKKTPELHDMLYAVGVNYDKESSRDKRGSCYRNIDKSLDRDIPIFTQNRSYIWGE